MRPRQRRLFLRGDGFNDAFMPRRLFGQQAEGGKADAGQDMASVASIRYRGTGSTTPTVTRTHPNQKASTFAPPADAGGGTVGQSIYPRPVAWLVRCLVSPLPV